MINPSVSLYTSAKILDQMMLAALPGGLKDFNDWLNRILGRFAEFFKEMGYVDLGHDFLYDIYKTVNKTRSPKRENLATMIGIAFRISSNNMIFTSDVMTNAGLIVPKNLTFWKARIHFTNTSGSPAIPLSSTISITCCFHTIRPSTLN